MSSLRHIALGLEETSTSGAVVDALVCKSISSDAAILVLFDRAAEAADVLAAVSKAGEISSSELVKLPAALAGVSASKGSRASDWAAMHVKFESASAWKRLRGLGRPAPQVDEDGKPVGMASECWDLACDWWQLWHLLARLISASDAELPTQLDLCLPHSGAPTG